MWVASLPVAAAVAHYPTVLVVVLLVVVVVVGVGGDGGDEAGVERGVEGEAACCGLVCRCVEKMTGGQ